MDMGAAPAIVYLSNLDILAPLEALAILALQATAVQVAKMGAAPQVEMACKVRGAAEPLVLTAKAAGAAGVAQVKLAAQVAMGALVITAMEITGVRVPQARLRQEILAPLAKMGAVEPAVRTPAVVC